MGEAAHYYLCGSLFSAGSIGRDRPSVCSGCRDLFWFGSILRAALWIRLAARNLFVPARQRKPFAVEHADAVDVWLTGRARLGHAKVSRILFLLRGGRCAGHGGCLLYG